MPLKDPNIFQKIWCRFRTKDAVFKQIVAELKAKQKEVGVIFLAVQATEGVKLVKLLKDSNIPNIIVGSSSFSEQTFRNGFDKFPAEKKRPGIH